MPFQFVHATPDDTDYSAETRRRIRSQAMRDYRRRQRDELQDIESSSEPSPPSSVASPPLSSKSPSREASRPRNSSSHSLSVQQSLLRRHSSGTSSDNPQVSQSRPRGEKRRSPQPSHESEESQSSPRRRRRTKEPSAQRGVFSQFMISLPARPSSPTLGDDIEALQSPGQIDVMLQACEHYNTWLTCRSKPAESTRDAVPCNNSAAQLLLSALCLQSIGHLETVRPRRVSLDKGLLKTGILASLNKRLKDGSTALEDNTIGALACLASYEMSQGSKEATVHLAGLQQILSLRGGTRKLQGPAGLPMLLEMLDLTHAVYFHTDSTFTQSESSSTSFSEQNSARISRTTSGSIELDQGVLDDINNVMISGPEVANEGCHLPSAPGLEAIRMHHTFDQTLEDQEIELWSQHLSGTNHNISTAAVAHACRIAAEIHMLTTSPVRPHPMRMQAKADELFETAFSVTEEEWDAAPTLHTRILLTALSAAASQRAKSWYLAHLTRRLYQTSSEEWTGVKALLLRFIDMQRTARARSRSRAVMARARDLGVEIVVASAEEAEGMGLRVD